MDGRQQWRSKALRGPDFTVTWGLSVPSAGPKGLKLEAQSAESGGAALGRESLLQKSQRFVYTLYGFLLLTCQFFRSGVFFSCVIFLPPDAGGPQELGAPVH